MRKIHYTLYSEDSDFVVQCLDYDISTFGSTEQDALANLKEAVELYLEDSPENSMAISEVKVGESKETYPSRSFESLSQSVLAGSLKKQGVTKENPLGTSSANLLVLIFTLVAALNESARCAPEDNGLPLSKSSEFIEKPDSKTSSKWKTYYNKTTEQTLSFDPNKARIWYNPNTKNYETVLRENDSPDPKEANGGVENVKKTAMVYNPVTKRFEEIIVETSPGDSGASQIQYPVSSDNGLPPSTAKNWDQIFNDKTGSEWRTYKNAKTGQQVSFDPNRSVLWFNPVKKLWEPVSRETSVQKSYIKVVARQLAEKNKPANANRWKCNYSGTEHPSPADCQDPDQGGVWLK